MITFKQYINEQNVSDKFKYMENLPIEEKPIAEYKDEKGYKITIHKWKKQPDFNKTNYSRDPIPKAQQIIHHPNGNKIKGGWWMDWPEKHWGFKNDKEYYKLPENERAQLEAKEQATKHNLETTYNFHKPK